MTQTINVVIESTNDNGKSWSEFLSFNCAPKSARTVIEHAARKTHDAVADNGELIPDYGFVRLTVREPQNPAAFDFVHDHEIAEFLDANW